MSLSTVLLIVALICFILAAIPVDTKWFRAQAWGFVFWLSAILIAGGVLQLR